MSFFDKLDRFHLLKHKFYDAWNAGELTKKDLQEYVCQYYHHVNNFPRYLSAIHTLCDDISVRKVILGNLMDEEHGEEDHPELLLRFADGLDLPRDKVKSALLYENTQWLNNTFFELVNSSVPEGIGALFAYERQVPEVSVVKISTLKEFYGITDDHHLKFFSVHIDADEWHSEECTKLINDMDDEDRVRAESAALEIAESLWIFLDKMEEVRKSKVYLNV